MPKLQKLENKTTECTLLCNQEAMDYNGVKENDLNWNIQYKENAPESHPETLQSKLRNIKLIHPRFGILKLRNRVMKPSHPKWRQTSSY